MWTYKEFNLGYVDMSAVTAWLNEIHAVDAQLFYRSNGVLVVAAKAAPVVKPVSRPKTRKAKE